MPKFYCLYNSAITDSLNVSERIETLKDSCIKNNIEFVLVDEYTIDFRNLPIPTSEDGFYNVARNSTLLESAMLNPNVRTFYRSFSYIGNLKATNHWSMLHKTFGVSTPKTIFKGTRNRSLLKEYVEYLNGFPLILKTYGGTGGVGVMKIDSFETLFSIADYLIASNANFAMKEFIPSKSCERLTVLGNEVIAGVCRPNKEKDFRSDVFDPKTYAKEYSKEINDLAIAAAHVVNINLGGIDIIIDERDNKPYVLETNFPLNFMPSQKVTGINIAEKMIKFLFK